MNAMTVYVVALSREEAKRIAETNSVLWYCDESEARHIAGSSGRVKVYQCSVVLNVVYIEEMESGA